MNLSDLLAKQGVDPKDVVVLRHRPTEPKLRQQLRRIALEDENAFMAYQSSHRVNTERALKTARYIASFLADGPQQAIFVGLYEITGMDIVPHDRWLENPTIRSLVDGGSDVGETRTHVGWFHQKRIEFTMTGKVGWLLIGHRRSGLGIGGLTKTSSLSKQFTQTMN
jgi:hypothetical protein